MTQRELIVPLYLKDDQAVSGREDCSLCQDGDAVRIAEYASNAGADALLVLICHPGMQRMMQRSRRFARLHVLSTFRFTGAEISDAWRM